MRVALTVVAPAMRRTADVFLEADQATPMADIAAELASCIVGDTMERHHAPGYGGQPQGARILRFPAPGPRVRSRCPRPCRAPNGCPFRCM